ncbi:MAG: nitroreductase family protein [Phycisphaerae bacterium]|nr:nitroreductase family protein [Phycisphaerae bacterium]
MDLMDAIKQRYSCRAYQDKPVEADKLNTLFEAARLAPSARNSQDWRFVVVTNPETRNALQSAAANQPFVGQAPVVLAACSCTNKRMNLCAQPYASVNVSIALEHIALAAVSLGLATCWVGSFKPQQVRQILNIPTDITVVELMTLGYPADKGASQKRLKQNEIACYEKWEF